jgi:predicted MFS family arabinose efflux permease
MAYLGALAELYGTSGLFIVMIVFAGLAVFASSGLLRGHQAVAGTDHPAENQKVTGLGWLSMFSVLLWFTGVGASYAYLAFMGVAWGGSQTAVEASLSYGMFAGVAGAVTVALVGSRFGFKKPLYFSSVSYMLALFVLVSLKPVAGFVLVVCLCSYMLNLVIPYQFEAVTQIDRSNSAAMLVNAATLGGFAIGPAIAANMVTTDYQLIIVSCLCAVLASLALLAITIGIHEKQHL